MQRYQETFRAFIRGWDADADPADVLRVDLLQSCSRRPW